MAKHANVPYHIRFDCAEFATGITSVGIAAYLKKNGEREFAKEVAKVVGRKLGKDLIVEAGWANLALTAVSLTVDFGLSMAGYRGIEIMTDSVFVERTHHQNGDVTTVVTCEPRKIISVKLYK